ncbi:hypothetical protein Leryth_003267 [Lithospermum erythrorhizon]|nr:hypothetical protein Leryth_003267 [Lithospermum erythrorhizon]
MLQLKLAWEHHTPIKPQPTHLILIFTSQSKNNSCMAHTRN